MINASILTAITIAGKSGFLMTLREEIRQFMIVSESLLDDTIKEADLTYIEHELLHYYVLKVSQKFPTHPKLSHSSMQDNADRTSQPLPSESMAREERRT